LGTINIAVVNSQSEDSKLFRKEIQSLFDSNEVSAIIAMAASVLRDKKKLSDKGEDFNEEGVKALASIISKFYLALPDRSRKFIQEILLKERDIDLKEVEEDAHSEANDLFFNKEKELHH
jgi:hypothetical protein